MRQQALNFLQYAVKSGTNRYYHSLMVAEQLENMYSNRSPEEKEEAYTLGVLHDIGYEFPDTGYHAVDGASRLTKEKGLEQFIPYVAWHSTSKYECAELQLTNPYPFPSNLLLHNALWVADFTITPQGHPTSLEQRVSDIRDRYRSDQVVLRSLDACTEDLEAAVAMVKANLNMANISC